MYLEHVPCEIFDPGSYLRRRRHRRTLFELHRRLARRGEAQVAVALQALQDDRVEGDSHPWGRVTRRFGGSANDSADDLSRPASAEQPLPRQQLPQDTPPGANVGTSIDLTPQNL